MRQPKKPKNRKQESPEVDSHGEKKQKGSHSRLKRRRKNYGEVFLKVLEKNRISTGLLKSGWYQVNVK